MDEVQVAAKAAPAAKHLFYDAQIFWASIAALLSASIGAFAVRYQVKSRSKELQEERREKTKTICVALLAECTINATAISYMYLRPAQHIRKFTGENGIDQFRRHFDHRYFDMIFEDVGLLGRSTARLVMLAYRHHSNWVETFCDATDEVGVIDSEDFEKVKDGLAQTFKDQAGVRLSDWHEAIDALERIAKTGIKLNVFDVSFLDKFGESILNYSDDQPETHHTNQA